MNEEELSVCVQKYEVLYDKSHKDFLSKDIKKNAWTAVAEEIGLDSGDEAERAFIRLRDKYVRARKMYKESFKSGASAKSIKKSKYKLYELSFMSWLDHHIRPRQTRNDEEEDDTILLQDYLLVLPEDSGSVSDVDDNDLLDKRSLVNDDDSQPSSSNNVQVNGLFFQNPLGNENRNLSKRKRDLTDIEKEEIGILRSFSGPTQGKKVEDEFDIFGKHIANKMRRMSKVLDDDEMELLEYDINSLFMRARNQKQKTVLYADRVSLANF